MLPSEFGLNKNKQKINDPFVPTVSISINDDSLGSSCFKENTIIKFTCFRLWLSYEIYCLLLTQWVSQYFWSFQLWSNCSSLLLSFCSKYHYHFIRRMEMKTMLNTEHCTPLPSATQVSKGNHSIWITITRQFSFYIIYILFQGCCQVEGSY